MSDRPPVTPKDRAVVLGGSISGLLAARVLADHFREVVVLERDRLPEQAGPRKGTPQAAHPTPCWPGAGR